MMWKLNRIIIFNQSLVYWNNPQTQKTLAYLRAGFQTLTFFILLMAEIPNNHLRCIKPCRQWDKLPTSTGFHAGFLNHQQYLGCQKSKVINFRGKSFMWPGGVKSQMRLATGERKKFISLVEQMSWSQFSMLIANISNTFLINNL